METIMFYGFILFLVIVSSVMVYKYTTPESASKNNNTTSVKEAKTICRGEELREIHDSKFSWTVLFFGFFVPLIRSDWKWALIMFLISIVTFGLSNIYFAFNYNSIHKNELYKMGFK